MPARANPVDYAIVRDGFADHGIGGGQLPGHLARSYLNRRLFQEIAGLFVRLKEGSDFRLQISFSAQESRRKGVALFGWQDQRPLCHREGEQFEWRVRSH